MFLIVNIIAVLLVIYNFDKRYVRLCFAINTMPHGRRPSLHIENDKPCFLERRGSFSFLQQNKGDPERRRGSLMTRYQYCEQ